VTFGSLFAGIGGFDLGFERAGLRCEWQVEIDRFRQRVLERHFPGRRLHDDARTFTPGPAREWSVDCIIGGPPCQPSSTAGKQLGESDERWLWPDTIRIIGDIRPSIAVLENPPAILTLDRGRTWGRILGGLAEAGFDAEWDVLSACMLRAPHTRARLFIVAYPVRSRFAGFFGREARRKWLDSQPDSTCGPNQKANWNGGFRPHYVRVADGLPDRVDRVAAIGDSVSPIIAEWIGHRLMEAQS
jgi:DNA (cytosine-5)-methyltransferase 1